MNVLDYFDPKGEKYHEENGGVRRRLFESALRKVETPFHWQFTRNRNTEYSGEFIQMKTKDYRFSKSKEEELRNTEVDSCDDSWKISEPDSVLNLLREVVSEIDSYHDSPEMIVFHDLTVITLEMDELPVLVSYSIV